MKKPRCYLALTLFLFVAYPAFGQVATPLTQNSELKTQNSVGTSVPTVAPTPYPTPIVSPAPKLDSALKKAMILIDKDLKSGKLAKSQATSLKSQVLAIRKQELADIKSNGKRELTSSQESGLMGQLEQLEGTL